MEYSKEDLIEEYNKLKEHLGKSPSSRSFYSETGISRRKLEENFGSSAFTKLVEEAGDKPNVFSTEKIELEEILNQWGINWLRICVMCIKNIKLMHILFGLCTIFTKNVPPYKE